MKDDITGLKGVELTETINKSLKSNDSVAEEEVEGKLFVHK